MKENLIKLFDEWNPDLLQKMKDTSHHYSEEFLNPWHLEGSVFDHTLMVMDEVAKRNGLDILMYAALLHDIGKVYTRKENHEKKRVSFYNHEALSIQPAIDFMKHLGEDDEFITIVIQIIFFHMRGHKVQSFNELVDFAGGDENLAELMRQFNYADGNGRISEIKVEQRV